MWCPRASRSVLRPRSVIRVYWTRRSRGLGRRSTRPSALSRSTSRVIPPVVSAITQQDHVDQTLGLAFHSDSAFLRGMLMAVSGGTAAGINGAVIPARSENDTGNNPHNPMYGIARAGADGSLLGLIGSRNADSGGNSMAPVMMINPEDRPTKVDRPSDVTGLVDTGALVGLLNQADAVKVLESIHRASHHMC